LAGSRLVGRANAARLIANDSILTRIKELQTAVATGVIQSEIRRRSWRVELLQKRVDKLFALSDARAKMYESEMAEGFRFEVADKAAELAAIASGCTVAPVFTPAPAGDWKDLPAAAGVSQDDDPPRVSRSVERQASWSRITAARTRNK
jgi:hypothetical protein